MSFFKNLRDAVQGTTAGREKPYWEIAAYLHLTEEQFAGLVQKAKARRSAEEMSFKETQADRDVKFLLEIAALREELITWGWLPPRGKDKRNGKWTLSRRYDLKEFWINIRDHLEAPPD